MNQAMQGNVVKVHYTGKLADGTVFDSTTKRDPVQFKIGAAEVIRGFEQSVIGMHPGESKTVVLSSEQAFGLRREDQVMNVERKQLPPELKLAVGQQLQIPQNEGKPPVTVRVTQLSDSKVTLDGNHPLAGEDLTFDIQLVAIE